VPDPQSIQAALVWLYFLAVAIGLYVMGRVAMHVATRGDKVRAGDMDLPELFMTIVLAGTSMLLIANAALRQAKVESEPKIDSVLPSALFFVIIAAGVLAFLRYVRRLRVTQVFGLDQVRPLAVLGWAVGLCLAFLPLAALIASLTKLVLKDNFAQQPLVDLYSRVVREGDYAAMGKIALTAAVLAPCCEEFLFRGFFYGVWKRYLGPRKAAILASLLFAAMHTSLSSFPALFVLALCLTLAYERTGSLLVPIGFHACFNFTSLLVIYLPARFPHMFAPP
jgi:membrane protease YdiL (CAAX protease family)